MNKGSKLRHSTESQLENLPRLAQKDLKWADRLFNGSRDISGISYAQALKISGSHPELITKCLEDEAFRNDCDGYDLAFLCESNDLSALKILDDKYLSDKLNGIDLAVMGQRSKVIAEKIFSIPRFLIRLENEHLASLASQSEKVAMSILSRPAVQQKLDGKGYAKIVKNHPQLGQALVKARLLNQLDGDELCYFGEHHEFIARTIIDSKIQRKKLKGYTIHILGRTHESIALRIFHDQELMYLSGPLAWAELAKNHASFAELLLKSKECSRELDGTCLVNIAKGNTKLARFMYDQVVDFKNEAYTQKMNLIHLCALGEIDASVAHLILDNEEFKKELSSNQLQVLGYKHPDVANRILGDVEFSKKLSGIHVTMLAFASNEIIDKIFNNKELLAKVVDSKTLPMLCRRYAYVLQKSADDEDLHKNLTPWYIEHIQRRSRLITLIKSKIHDLVEGLNEHDHSVRDELKPLALTPFYNQRKKTTLPNFVDRESAQKDKDKELFKLTFG